MFADLGHFSKKSLKVIENCSCFPDVILNCLLQLQWTSTWWLFCRLLLSAWYIQPWFYLMRVKRHLSQKNGLCLKMLLILLNQHLVSSVLLSVSFCSSLTWKFLVLTCMKHAKCRSLSSPYLCIAISSCFCCWKPSNHYCQFLCHKPVPGIGLFSQSKSYTYIRHDVWAGLYSRCQLVTNDSQPWHCNSFPRHCENRKCNR